MQPWRATFLVFWLLASCGSRSGLAAIGVDAGSTDTEPALACELHPVAEPWIWGSARLNTASPAVVASGRGFVAVWTHPLVDYSSGRGELIAAALDADGRVLAETRLLGADEARAYAPRLYATPRGLLLTWLEQPHRLPARGCLRWLDDLGTPLGPPLCPEELRGGRLIVDASAEPVLVATRRAESPAVWELSDTGPSHLVAELPAAPQALARDGPDLVWLLWTAEPASSSGALDLVGPTWTRRVASRTPHSDGGEIRILRSGHARVLWRHAELVVTDVAPTGEVRDVLRWDGTGGLYSWHPELHVDGRIAFGRDRRHADRASEIEVIVRTIGLETAERGFAEPGPHGCHPPGAALGHDRVAVAWVGATPGRSTCIPHFAVLRCPE